jgi:uncharacterized protein with PIN domain
MSLQEFDTLIDRMNLAFDYADNLGQYVEAAKLLYQMNDQLPDDLQLTFEELDNPDVARCTKCNSTTSQISKLKIENKVPQGVLEFNDKFWKCDKCDQIYWEGTHIKNLQEFVHKINLYS